MSTYHTEITRADEELELEIEYTSHAACKGARDSLMGVRGAGPPLEPDEDAHIEIESAVDVKTGKEIELTNQESTLIEQEIMEACGDE